MSWVKGTVQISKMVRSTDSWRKLCTYNNQDDHVDPNRKAPCKKKKKIPSGQISNMKPDRKKLRFKTLIKIFKNDKKIGLIENNLKQ